jgi:aspartate 1-decarboxylase
LGRIGDRITVMSFIMADESDAKRWQPRVIVLGEKNLVINQRGI